MLEIFLNYVKKLHMHSPNTKKSYKMLRQLLVKKEGKIQDFKIVIMFCLH